MAKFHINGKGIPAPCKATKGNCPYGGSTGTENHFNSIEEAQEFANKQNEQQHGLLAINGKPNPPTAQERKEMNMKEVSVLLINGQKVNGIFHNREGDPSYITIDELGSAFEGKVTIKSENIQNMTLVSNHSYFSRAYEEECRALGKPTPQFRFNETQLNNYKDKFAIIKANGITYSGEIIRVNYVDENNSAIIMLQENGEIKNINNKDLYSLRVTGNNVNEHKGYKRIKEITDNGYKNYVDDSEPGSFDWHDDSLTDPTEAIDNYFKGVIDREKGLDVNLDKLKNINFVDEVDKDNYEVASNYYDYDNGGGQYTEWTDESSEMYEQDLTSAEINQDFFDNRVSVVDKLVNDVKNTEWAEYYGSQKAGVIKALEDLFDSGIASDY